MKNLMLLLACAFTHLLQAQNVGIGIASPQKKLSVNGSIMLDAENRNTGLLDSAALVFGTNAEVGIAAPKTGLRNGSLDIYTDKERRISISKQGQVNINSPNNNKFGFSIVADGTSYVEDIVSEKVFADSSLQAGNFFRAIKTPNGVTSVKIGPDIAAGTGILQVNGGLMVDNGYTYLRERTEVGVNTPDGDYGLLVWSDAYVDGDITMTGTNPILQMKQGFDNKGFLQVSGDNIRIGTNSGNSAGNLIIRNNGGDRVTVDAGGNMNVQGDVTVSAGKGVVYNSHGSGQLKYYTRTASFAVGLAGDALSSETTIGFTAGIFSSPPKVFAGDIVSTGGTSGELYRVQLIIYGVTTTSCKVRLLNTSSNPVNYNITWNIVCIGE
jgi:hypothetical protein